MLGANFWVRPFFYEPQRRRERGEMGIIKNAKICLLVLVFNYLRRVVLAPKTNLGVKLGDKRVSYGSKKL